MGLVRWAFAEEVKGDFGVEAGNGAVKLGFSSPLFHKHCMCLGDIPKLSVNLRQIVSFPFAAPVLDGQWLWVGSLVHNQVLRSLSPFIPCKGLGSFSVLV